MKFIKEHKYSVRSSQSLNLTSMEVAALTKLHIHILTLKNRIQNGLPPLADEYIRRCIYVNNQELNKTIRPYKSLLYKCSKLEKTIQASSI